MLAAAPPQEQKQMLGERLFPLIQRMYPDLAGKITGMLLEIDNSELLHMLEHHESLKAKVIAQYSLKLWFDGCKCWQWCVTGVRAGQGGFGCARQRRKRKPGKETSTQYNITQ
jgi:hypothetical protein